MADRPRDSRTNILLIDDDVPFRRALAIGLRLEGLCVFEAATREEALGHLGAGRFALALVNQFLSADRGEELLSEIGRRSPWTRLVTVACRPDLVSTLAAAGRAVQLVKPVPPEAILGLLAHAG